MVSHLRPAAFSLRARSLPTALAALSWSFAAHSAPCKVGLTGADAAAWREAVNAIEALQLTDDDCASIEVAIAEEGARVTFTTTDGRQAVRTIASPVDLYPTIDALRVRAPTADDAPPPASAERGATRIEAKYQPAVAADPALRRDRVRLPAREDDAANSGLRFAVLGGARGGDQVLASPVLGAMLSLLQGGWELSVAGSAELNYFGEPNPSGGPDNRGALVLGAGVGRRTPISQTDVLFGGRLSAVALFAGAYSTSEPAPAPELESSPSDDRSGEWRVGAYLGAAFPRRAPVHFRADLATDFVIGGEAASTPPRTPAWAVSALIGFEVGGR